MYYEDNDTGDNGELGDRLWAAQLEGAGIPTNIPGELIASSMLSFHEMEEGIEPINPTRLELTAEDREWLRSNNIRV